MNTTEKADKLSISLPAELSSNVREAASRSGVGVSAWLAEAAARRLRSEALGRFLEEWEREHGALTDEEVAQAEERLGWRRGDRADTSTLRERRRHALALREVAITWDRDNEPPTQEEVARARIELGLPSDAGS